MSDDASPLVPKTKDWILLLILGAIWGASFLVIKKAVQVYEPQQMTFLRMTIATIIYFPFALYYWKQIDWTKWKAFVIVALCGSGIPNWFFAIAETKISSGVAGVLNAMVPLFTLILGVLIFKQKVTWTKTIGILTGLAGATFLILYNRQFQDQNTAILPALLCLAAGIMYAINSNTIGAYLKGVHPIAVGAASFTLTGVFYLAGGVWTGAFPKALLWSNIHGTLMVVYLAVLGTVLASILYVRLVQRTNPIFATSVAYLFPVFSLFFGILDQEPMHWGHFAGLGVILFGLYLSRK